MILPPGTQVVTRVDVVASGGHPTIAKGAVGEIVDSPTDADHAYRIRFASGDEAALKRAQFAVLKHLQRDGLILPPDDVLAQYDLYDCVIYRCVVGSRAYGLEETDSDVDRRGIYLAPAEMQWSLYGAPEQLERPETQECYWELQKFLTLALKANPNVLECLYTPLVEFASPPARELLEMRGAFLSKLIYQTYNGYVMSQFKKLTARLKSNRAIKWKHAMHLIRLLLAGITALREGVVPVSVEEHRDRLLAIRRGENAWEEVNTWRLELHQRFDEAFKSTRLPDRPDYDRANAFLIDARRAGAVAPRPTSRATAATLPTTTGCPEQLRTVLAEQPHPLLFVTISGAHLYGFASPDSDYDLRGAHILPLEEVVGLRKPCDTIEKSARVNGLEIDLVTHDVAKFFRLLLKNNGYALEQLYSPLILQTTPEHDELKRLAHGCISRHHAEHYLGFGRNQWELYEQQRTIKALLYAYRVLLTGIHLMQTGRVEANLPRLNEEFKLPCLNELIARKIGGLEKDSVGEAEIDRHKREYKRLTSELEAAQSESALPTRSDAEDDLNTLLLNIRLRPR